MTGEPEEKMGADYLVVYLPERGVHAATVLLIASDRVELLQKAFDACPPGKRLSRVHAANPSQGLWEAGKGWLLACGEPRHSWWD